MLIVNEDVTLSHAFPHRTAEIHVSAIAISAIPKSPLPQVRRNNIIVFANDPHARCRASRAGTHDPAAGVTCVRARKTGKKDGRVSKIVRRDERRTRPRNGERRQERQRRREEGTRRKGEGRKRTGRKEEIARRGHGTTLLNVIARSLVPCCRL